jgi:transcriptional regulator with XRE-family HTH domain
MPGTLSLPARFRLREILEKSEISQSDFARQAHLSFATVNRICTNATGQVSLETIDKVLSALARSGVRADAADLIAWDQSKTRRG